MKLHEVKHINEVAPKDDPELIFVSSIGRLYGELCPSEFQPEHWDNVRRLTENLFLAWNDSNPTEGTVYLGEFK